ncbi:MAG: tRNA 2-thiouridine(34) synthase MnmA [SAR324 cluster bacterium]|nr:tRNA 2-thiouridine(34) synthase MnmA [SAR324 cluster bacterium]MBL7035880.1 tRNA 2-thiouridine(34) synthase MnmA [SAR324 cluster bacterium]
MARVAMAISGGVDSSVAAVLLKEQGHDVIGLHMKLYHGPENNNRQKSCCSLDEAIEARIACHRLDIPFYVLDYQDEFRESVIDYFVEEYSGGKTPNPCVMCNKIIKNDLLLKKTEELGCDFLATGHYAKIIYSSDSGRSQLSRPQDLKKDQTYFLHGIKSEELSRLMFPLSDIIKPEVRKIAERLKLSAAKKPDSQEICFVPKDYRSFLKQELSLSPEPGDFISLSGDVLGEHLGLAFYTIGQRRGLGISDSTPYYVVKIDFKSNTVVLGKEDDLFSQTIWVSDVNWVSISPPEEPICVSVKPRYSHRGATATVYPEMKNQVRVEFEKPERAITPGQAAVFYQDKILLGGGWIKDSP